MDIEYNDPKFMEKLLADYKALSEDRVIILSKIRPWLDSVAESSFSKIEKNQKTKEIIDVGNFLYYYDKEIKIVNAISERPDCIVSKEEKIIGIELKDLIIHKSEKEKEGVLKSIFNKVQIELETYQDKYKGIYRIEFHNDNFSLKAKDKVQIKKEIISAIEGKLHDEKYIKEVIRKPSSGISLYNGNGTFSGALKREVVEAEIKSKEIKFDNYRSNELHEIWLLLVLSGIKKSSDYSFLEESITTDPYETNFHQIFIYNSLKRKIYKLKTCPSTKNY